MPIYEYRCANCGHQLEVLQKISDQPRVHCPSCDQETLQKLISAPSFRLKGGGWYETDFKKGNKKHLADGGEGNSTDSKAPDKKADNNSGGGETGKSGATAGGSSGAVKSGTTD